MEKTAPRVIAVSSARLPADCEERAAHVVTVLKMGHVEDYACYRGVILGDGALGDGDIEWVAAHGDKLSFEQASEVFPGLESARYRR